MYKCSHTCHSTSKTKHHVSHYIRQNKCFCPHDYKIRQLPLPRVELRFSHEIWPQYKILLIIQHFLVLNFYFVFSHVLVKIKKATVCRLWSQVRKDENTPLWSARVNCEERKRERGKMMWKPGMLPAGWLGFKRTPTQNPNTSHDEAFQQWHNIWVKCMKKSKTKNRQTWLIILMYTLGNMLIYIPAISR